MRKRELEEFIQYVKDQFECELRIHESDDPDSFESIFGASFLSQNDRKNIPINFEENLVYNQIIEKDSVIACTNNMDLAA